MDIDAELKRTKQETEHYFKLSEKELSKSYGLGKWNVKQILIHLADTEGVLIDNIKRVISEPHQVIWAFDQDLWSQKLNYLDLPLSVSQNLYLANRDAIIDLAQRYYKSLSKVEFVHNLGGLKTLKGEFDKVATHNEAHLVHIRLALKS